MRESILVTGGTGTLGRHVVDRLHGSDIRVLTRSPRASAPYTAVAGDLATGVGLDEAVAGAGTIVHLASDPRRPRTDVDGTRRLIDAARRAGTRHLVFISIVGVDRHPYAYYQAKYVVEGMIEDSGLPYTIVRTTQFHDLVLFMAQTLARLPVTPIPSGWSFQPVETGEVADRMAALALSEPAGRVPDMGGPEILPAREFVGEYLAAVGRRRPLVPVRVPGKVSQAFRRGVHLAPDHADGRRVYREFLAERVRRGRPAAGYGRSWA